jgi:hypothetical protein
VGSRSGTLTGIRRSSARTVGRPRIDPRTQFLRWPFRFFTNPDRARPFLCAYRNRYHPIGSGQEDRENPFGLTFDGLGVFAADRPLFYSKEKSRKSFPSTEPAGKVKGSVITGTLVMKLTSTFCPIMTVGRAALSLYPNFSISTLV